MAQGRSSAWWSVLRGALLFTPVLAVAVIALAFLVSDVSANGASAGSVLALVLIGSVSMLLTYQVVQSMRDLFSSLVETTGEVERCWTRNDFFLFRNSYVFVGRDVFRIPSDHNATPQAGDRVRVIHYPHTGAVEMLEVLDESSAGERDV